ncbi:MAG: A/G-specific adenine glycosylase [Bacteroidales bacterium]|nr:A/G-specific adenine glycosylase [Bacteroidales bacterium]
MEDIKYLLIKFFEENKRDLPFRKERNAYHILLSEIIMQQTRIDQGTPYFLRIVEKFPTINHLAAAAEDELLRLWQGLGYYSRARNLHATAKNIADNYGGIIPNAFAELRKLKGIGDYTAAAVASIAFNEPVPVVDGNVMRVVARLFAIDVPVNSAQGKNIIKEKLLTIFLAEEPGLFNEAIMEFGALQCTPANPNCPRCVLKGYCQAYKMSATHKFPVKLAPQEVKARYLNYLVLLSNNGRIWMRQRNDKDIWKNLYEFPLIETENVVANETLLHINFWNKHLSFPEKVNITFQKTVRKSHKLTHRLLNISFTFAAVDEIFDYFSDKGFISVSIEEAEKKPKPIVIANILTEFINCKLF